MSSSTFARQLTKATKQLAQVDAALGQVIARVGRPQLQPSPNFEPFQALVSSICHQQLHGKAARTILGRVQAKFGDGTQVDMGKVHRTRLSTLRGCGLSEAKALALKDLAKKRLDGTVPSALELHRLADDEVVECLSQVRGVGRWTAEMILIFQMGRLDVFPVDDFGVRKGFAMLRGLSAPLTAKTLLPEGERFRPYRSVASWYLWRLADGA